MDAAEREALTARWVEAMRLYVGFLVQQSHQNAEIAATLTVLELPNLFALLEQVQRASDAEATIDLATSLYQLLQHAGKPRLLERLAQVRDAAAATLSETWNHARLQAKFTWIEQQLAGGDLRKAFDGAQDLLRRARAAGEAAYQGAAYDLAMACWLGARVLTTAGGTEQALPLLDEAHKRFETVERERPGCGEERMIRVCFEKRAECLLQLGRLHEASELYEECIHRAEKLGDNRGVALGKAQLGSVRLQQRRYKESLEAYAEARERFTLLNEPGCVAGLWQQTGIVYQETRQPEAAEDAYRKALSLEVRFGNVAGQARTLGQLGYLYNFVLNRSEEAVTFLRQTADKYSEIRDVANEGRQRNNLGDALRNLRRLDEARYEIHRAIECKKQFGHGSEPWTSWGILADIEADAGNTTAAATAKRRAIECYLAYRRDGGENHTDPGRLCLAVTQPLLAGDPAVAASLLQEQASRYQTAGFGGFIQALQAVVAGSRDRALADAPELDYTMAAEILFLLDELEKAGK